MRAGIFFLIGVTWLIGPGAGQQGSGEEASRTCGEAYAVPVSDRVIEGLLLLSWESWVRFEVREGGMLGIRRQDGRGWGVVPLLGEDGEIRYGYSALTRVGCRERVREIGEVVADEKGGAPLNWEVWIFTSREVRMAGPGGARGRDAWEGDLCLGEVKRCCLTAGRYRVCARAVETWNEVCHAEPGERRSPGAHISEEGGHGKSP